MSELKLCPFCGGEASHDMAALPSDHPKFGTAWIVCHTCGTTGTMFDFRTDAEVIESQWNTRHAPEGYLPVPVDDLKRLYATGYCTDAIIKAVGEKA